MTQTAYLSEFKERKDIEDAYECKIPDSAEILLAYYGYGSYCGASFVLYRDGGKLYEVNGSHCSCNGLEGQWEPEETTVAALKARNGFYTEDGGNEAETKFKELLETLSDN